MIRDVLDVTSIVVVMGAAFGGVFFYVVEMIEAEDPFWFWFCPLVMALGWLAYRLMEKKK